MIYVKMKWPACHERGTKKKIWVPGTQGERGHILGLYDLNNNKAGRVVSKQGELQPGLNL